MRPTLVTKWLPATLLIFLFTPAPIDAKDCKAAQRNSCNVLLLLDDADKAQAENTHLPYGIPTSPTGATNERLLHQTDYIINYDADLLVPTWVAYRLRDTDIQERERLDCFRPDPRLLANDSAELDDYKEDNQIYDRGHMAPRAAFNRSECAMINTFILTNMTPQHDRFNRCTWRWLEENEREWAKLKGEIYVIIGAIFDSDADGKRDADNDVPRIETLHRVALPSHFYRIILHTRPNTFVESMTFILPHKDETQPFNQRNQVLKAHLDKIETVEALTGITFLESLAVENPVKAQAVRHFKAQTMWSEPEKEPDFLDNICNAWANQ
jgi:endonuclease G, mitochondrial